MQQTDHVYEGTHPERPIRPARARLFTIAAVASGVLVAGCGGSSPSATTGGGASSTESAAANAGAATTSAASSQGSSPSPAQPDQNLLNFARCMRANGVPNFPDPKPGGGFSFPASPAPAFAAAQAKCQKLLPNGGAPPPFDPQALVQLRQIAVCMRRHGVPDFPDPAGLPRAAHQTRRPAATRSRTTAECSSRSRLRSTHARRRSSRRRLRAAAGSSTASDQSAKPSRTIGFVNPPCRSQAEQEETRGAFPEFAVVCPLLVVAGAAKLRPPSAASAAGSGGRLRVSPRAVRGLGAAEVTIGLGAAEAAKSNSGARSSRAARRLRSAAAYPGAERGSYRASGCRISTTQREEQPPTRVRVWRQYYSNQDTSSHDVVVMMPV